MRPSRSRGHHRSSLGPMAAHGDALRAVQRCYENADQTWREKYEAVEAWLRHVSIRPPD